MVKSIRFSPMMVASSKFPKTASTGSMGVDTGRQIPINDVFKAINLITAKQQQHRSFNNGLKINAVPTTNAVPVQHTNFEAINSSVNNTGNGDSRAKIIDSTSRKLADLIVTQLEASKLHHSQGLFALSASVEELLNWADHSLRQIQSASSHVRPLSLFSLSKSTESPFLTQDSRISSFSTEVHNGSASNHSKHVDDSLLSSRFSMDAGLGLDLASFIASALLVHNASSSSPKDHSHNSLFGKRIDSSFKFSSKDKGVNISYQETQRVLTGLGGLVEDSYGSGPLRYQQDMENGPPTSTHSSNPRELGES